MEENRQKYKLPSKDPNRSVPDSQTVDCFAPTRSFSAFRVQARWLIRKCVGMFNFILKFPLHPWNNVDEVATRVKIRDARWLLVPESTDITVNQTKY